jgi:hypothetical protein
MSSEQKDHWEKQYWPCQNLPPQRREILFLDTAHLAGFKPYMFGSENFGATAEPRGGVILCRGGRGKHWEVELGTTDATILSAHVDDFDNAAEAVLRWLGGVDVAEIVEHVRGHLFITPGTGRGYVLHDQGN